MLLEMSISGGKLYSVLKHLTNSLEIYLVAMELYLCLIPERVMAICEQRKKTFGRHKLYFGEKLFIM